MISGAVFQHANFYDYMMARPVSSMLDGVRPRDEVTLVRLEDGDQPCLDWAWKNLQVRCYMPRENVSAVRLANEFLTEEALRKEWGEEDWTLFGYE